MPAGNRPRRRPASGRVGSRPRGPPPRRRRAAPARAGVPVAAGVVVDVEPRRRHRAGRRSAAGRVGDRTTRSSWRWPRCSSGCPGCSSGCTAGVIADRVDRRLLVVVVDLLRAARARGALPSPSPTGVGRRADVLVAMFLLGRRRGVRRLRERHAAADARRARRPRHRQRPAPGRVPHDEPARRAAARGRSSSPSAPRWPFVVQALVRRPRAPCSSRGSRPRPVPSRDLEGTHVRRDIADGLRWIVRHPPVRTLALVILAFNITWGAAWSVLVLYSHDRLGMGEVGYGLLTTAARGRRAGQHRLVRLIERRVRSRRSCGSACCSRCSPTSRWR